jgi:hypothetical protein
MIGTIKKLHDQPVVVTWVHGDHVQVDHFAPNPWTPIAHVDSLAEMEPPTIDDEFVATVRRAAVQCLSESPIARKLAHLALQLAYAHEQQAYCSVATEQALCDEGKALDDALRENNELRERLDGVSKP